MRHLLHMHMHMHVHVACMLQFHLSFTLAHQ